MHFLLRSLRPVAVLSAVGMLASALATAMAPCEIDVASHLFTECPPYGWTVDAGHALAAAAAVPIALGTGGRRRRWRPLLAAFGAASLITVAVVHLLLLLGAIAHMSTTPQVVTAWALVGVWLVLHGMTAPVRPSPLAIALGVTMLMWALAFHGRSLNDAVRQAGGGLFAIGFAAWVLRASDVWPRGQVLIRFDRRPVIAWIQIASLVVGSVLLAFPALIVWLASTVQVAALPADPLFDVRLENRSQVAVRVRDVNVTSGIRSIDPGSTEEASIAIGHPRPVALQLTDDLGRTVICRADEYELFRAHRLLIVFGEPPRCVLGPLSRRG